MYERSRNKKNNDNNRTTLTFQLIYWCKFIPPVLKRDVETHTQTYTHVQNEAHKDIFYSYLIDGQIYMSNSR